MTLDLVPAALLQAALVLLSAGAGYAVRAATEPKPPVLPPIRVYRTEPTTRVAPPREVVPPASRVRPLPAQQIPMGAA